MAPSILTEAQLLQAAGLPSGVAETLLSVIKTMFEPRFVVESGTSVTLTENHRGAWVFLTNASLVTVTMPATGLGNGFLTTVTALGAAGATLSGTHVGGTTIAQNVTANLATIYDGSWFVQGAA